MAADLEAEGKLLFLYIENMVPKKDNSHNE